MISGFVYHKAYFDNMDCPKKKRIIAQITNLIYMYILFSVIYGLFKIVLSAHANEHITYIDILLIWIKPLGEYWYLYVLIIFYIIFSFFGITRVNSAIVLAVSITMCFVSQIMPEIFQLNNIFYYSFYFWTGIMISQKKQNFNTSTVLHCNICYSIGTSYFLDAAPGKSCLLHENYYCFWDFGGVIFHF